MKIRKKFTPHILQYGSMASTPRTERAKDASRRYDLMAWYHIDTYSSTSQHRSVRENAMIGRQRGAAKFIQIFESEDGTIYRLASKRIRGNNLSPLAVVSEGSRLEAKAVRLDDDVVSIELAGAPQCFDVCWQGRRIASMTPRRFEWLTTLRDLSMVNPSIDGAYDVWLAEHGATNDAPTDVDVDEIGGKPLISIVVPLYRTPAVFFHDMVESVLAQTYPAWELVLVNASPRDEELARALCACTDERIRTIALEENLGIAGNTNAGIRASKGSYVAFLDHDDMLDPRALEEYARCIEEHPDADLLYCDEDSFHEARGKTFSPLFKPEFNLDLLYSHNYLVHLLMVSRRALDQVELSPDWASGAQDYDLTLKVSEVARGIYHIPKVLYHWREHAESTNGGVMETKPYAIDASVRALEAHFERRGVKTSSVEPTNISCVFSVTFQDPGRPLTAVAPYRSWSRLQALVEGLAKQERPGELRVVAVGPKVHKDAEPLPDTIPVEQVPWEHPYDFAAMANAGARQAAGDVLLFCGDTVTFDAPGCLERLAGCLERPEVGVVAPKLFYPDGLVQHAGLYVLEDGSIGFLNQNFTAHMGGNYLGLAECSCSYSAVSPDCFMVRRSTYEGMGGLEERYGNALVAVTDLCFKARSRGMSAVVLPDAHAMNKAPVIRPRHSAVDAYGSAAALDLLWSTWDESWRTDVLDSPNYTMANSYLNLDIGRDIEAEAKRIIRRKRQQAM